MRRMHRGGSRGGSQNWQQQRHNTAPLLSAGPLMTDHLGLQDIDKELELLKRKREIIEQQQQILSHEFMRNEPQFNQSSRFDDYSELYDDMRTYDHPSRKRAIAVWQDEIPNKRFSGPSRAPRARPQRSGPVFNTGYVGAPPRQPYRPQNKPPQKNFNNSKVTKNTPPMNKLDTYPVAERKKLIGEANGTADGKSKLSKLRADREPSAQVTGRLELALGSIIKDIKSNPAHTDAVKSTSVMRQIKKTVRDRIREVMMNQIVGPGDAIKARYRQVYDVQSDNEIVEKALQSVSPDMPKIVTPEEYFKVNMNKIVETRLKEMLKTLEDITCGKIQILKTEETADPDPDSKPDETPKDEVVEKMEKSDIFLALEKGMMHRILLSIKKQIPHIVHIQNMDAKFNQLKNTIATETIKKLTRKPADESQDFSEDIADATLQAISTPKIPRSPYKPLPYFAKLMGKPGLPKRNLMQVFFEDFKPKSIKKHRSVHNLLFVGFEDKEAFDRLLAADGTKIGKFTLSIRVSERSHDDKQKASQEPSAGLNTSASSEDKILGPELDEQITNLLDDIKKDDQQEANPEIKEEPENTDNAYTDNQETDTQNTDPDNANNDADNANTDADNTNTDADNTNTDADNANSENIDENSTQQTVEAVDNTEETNTQDANGAQPEFQNEDAEKADAVPEIAETKLKGTPVRTSARLANTPSRVMTRRESSRLVSNDA